VFGPCYRSAADAFAHKLRRGNYGTARRSSAWCRLRLDRGPLDRVRSQAHTDAANHVKLRRVCWLKRCIYCSERFPADLIIALLNLRAFSPRPVSCHRPRALAVEREGTKIDEPPLCWRCCIAGSLPF